jgi:trehalose 6-phosphate phosphatase
MLDDAPRVAAPDRHDACRLPLFAPAWAFFLDVDGTLLEFAERPDAVSVDRALADLVVALSAACAGAVALVSGRGVGEIDRLFTPARLAVAGQHGVERRNTRGAMHRHAFPDDRLLRAAGGLRVFADAHRGVLLEEKECSLALHYRQAPQFAEAVRDAVARAARELGDGFEVVSGKFVHELKPGGRDKGIAIEEFMSEPPFAGRTAVFIGDDVTDEHGFATVNRAGGHSIKVGPGASIAPWRLADAAAVRSWLGAYVAFAGSSAGRA